MKVDPADPEKPIYLLMDEIQMRTHQVKRPDGYNCCKYDNTEMVVYVGVLYALKGGPNG